MSGKVDEHLVPKFLSRSHAGNCYDKVDRSVIVTLAKITALPSTILCCVIKTNWLKFVLNGFGVYI